MLRIVLFAVLLNVPVTVQARELARTRERLNTVQPTPAAPMFVRGDADGDGELAMNDAIAILKKLYRDGQAFDCDDAADFNDDGVLEMADALGILNFLYRGMAPPAGTRPGELQADTTSDALGCSRVAPTAEDREALVARTNDRVTGLTRESLGGVDRTTRNGKVSTAVTAGVDYDTLVDIPDLVYRQGNNLKTMQHDGSDKNAIGLAGLEPRWSADAKKIAYVYAYDIYTANRDGSDPKQHTFEGSSRRTREPAWSPDGQKIVCTRDGNLHVITLGSDGHTESMRWITSAATEGAEDSAPAWSPDGSRIAFIRAQDGGRELYFVNPDGTGVTQKTNTPENEYDPDWHPNGNGIVLSYTDGGADHNVRFISYAGFFPFAADILTNEHMDDRSPSFSPDGTRIAFQRRIQGFIFRTDIYTCTIAGSQEINLTNLSGDIPANLAGTPDWR